MHGQQCRPRREERHLGSQHRHREPPRERRRDHAFDGLGRGGEEGRSLHPFPHPVEAAARAGFLARACLGAHAHPRLIRLHVVTLIPMPGQR
ncbi:hypothetical protein ACFFX0_09645 [Citricoccus parietis]|uniref:Uncharacterized protein n=1 Tax=Citricoccus parietis TaxID=592307 RepID=A0ABV5FXM4_9MICC